MRDLRDLMTTVRAVESDPDVLQMCRNLAAEMLAAGVDYEDYIIDPPVLELDPDDRSAYLSDQVESLAEAIRRTTLEWAIFKMELVNDWRQRTGRQHDDSR
jgi:hypothetical protein